MKIFQAIKKIFKKKEYYYPREFCIIDYSSLALSFGVRDNRNKIISRYFVNDFGNLEVKTYPYSEELVSVLQEENHIPFYDKTTKKIKLPIFARILPSEISFTTR